MKCESCQNKDEEIYHLECRIKAILATQKTILAQRFNEGLQIGLAESKQIVQEHLKAKDEYFEENENMTNIILSLEDKVEKLEKTRVDV